MPRRYVLHPGMPEPRVAGLEFCYQLMDFLLECLSPIARKDLIPSALNQGLPIHPIHCRVEMFGFHQPADLVENLLAFVQSQIHCSLILIGVDASPIATNAAQ